MDNVAGPAPRPKYEIRVLEVLSGFPKASAAEIAHILHPDEPDIKKRTSQVSVALKRLEAKGKVKRVEKVGRSVLFCIPEKAIDETKPTIVVETEEKKEFLPTEQIISDQEIEIRKKEIKETIIRVKVERPEKFPEAGGLEKRILESLNSLKEAAASDIAVSLFPVEEKIRRTPVISVYLKRMGEKGKVEIVGRAGKKVLYRLKSTEPVKEKELQYGVENELLQILKNINEVSASEAAEKIYSGTENPKGKTSQLSVSLRRLEDKGLITETERRDGRVYFSLETRSRLQKATELPEFKLPEFKLPEFELPSLPRVPPVYSAVGLSMVVIALVFYNFGGFGLFALPGDVFALSLEQQEAAGMQNFIYGVSNVNSHPVRDVKVEAILPSGSSIADAGGADVSERDGMTILTWLFPEINPKEKQTLLFSGNISGEIGLFAAGLSEREKQQSILDRPVQAQLPAGEYEYKHLDIEPIGYLGEIAVQLTVGPEGTMFTEETVTIPEIPIVNITENVTVIPIQPPIVTPLPPENVTVPELPAVQPPEENITPPVAPPIQPPAPPSAENITPPPVTPPVQPPVQPEQPPQPSPTENVTPQVPQTAENVTPPAGDLQPTAGAVTPPSVVPPTEQPAPEPQPEQLPNTTVRIYLDPDTEMNGNEDLIGEAQVFTQWDGTLKVQLPAKKYNESMNLVFYSDKGAVVLLKSLSLKWLVEVPVNASEKFLSEFYQNVTLNETEMAIEVSDSHKIPVAADVSVQDSFGNTAPEVQKGAGLNQDVGAMRATGMKDDSNQKHTFKVTGSKQKIRITPEDAVVNEIILDGVETKGEIRIGLDDAPEAIPAPAGVTGWKKVYAVDLSGIDFSSGSLKATATANALYKCKDWNFSAQACTGAWERIMYLTLGQEYTVPLSTGDPGYGEANITIINVQSYPTVGGNWTVMFNTTGRADLKITALNGTTWSNNSDSGFDLKFLQVKCGNQTQQYSWVNNSVLITNYTCTENGNETSKVLTEGVHTLEFDFGGDKKYAKNYAVYQNVRTVSSAETWCGNVIAYDKIVVTSTGKLGICPYNGTAGTGWLNITMGPNGNFTIEAGGMVNGTFSGGTGGVGNISTVANATQGTDGGNWTVGIMRTWANNGGGGGGRKQDIGGGAGGGGGGFGGNGGPGGMSVNGVARLNGSSGRSYGSASSTLLLGGSGGGGGVGDTGSAGKAGGAGFKVNAGGGTIIIDGTINVTGEKGVNADDQDTGCGGGGSGGHVILQAYTIDLSGGKIHADGGAGGDSGTATDDAGGGGGGGGRIVILYNTLTNTSFFYSVGGGAKGAGGSTGATSGAGNSGTVYYGTGSFGNAAVYSVNMSAPTSDLNQVVDETFAINCTPLTGGVPANVNMSYEYNSSSMTWKAIPTSGSTNLTIITGNGNPEINVTNSTLYTATVTAKSSGTFNVRCRLYNSTYSVNSTTKQIVISSPTPGVDWNQTTISLGTVQKGSSGTNNASVVAGGAHANVKVYTLSGNGTGFITANPTTIGSMTDGASRDVLLNCSPSAAQGTGYYEVLFGVNSTEDTTSNNITAGCIVSISLSDFAYRVNYTVQNSVAKVLTDYQVNISVDTQDLIAQSQMRSDCGDVRFTNSSGTVLSYWMEDGACNNLSTTFWVKVPVMAASGAQNVTMYYGEPSSTSTSDGNAVFLLFDDFNGASLNTTKWTTGYYSREVNGPWLVYNTGFNTPTVDGSGNMIMNGTRTATDVPTEDGVPFGWMGRSIRSASGISEQNFTIESKMWFNESSYYGATAQGPGETSWSVLGVGDNKSYIDEGCVDTQPRILRATKTNGVNAETGNYFHPNYNYLNQWARYKLVFLNGATQNTTFVTSTSPLNISTTTNFALSNRIVYLAFSHRDLSSNVTQKADWILVRKYADAEPTVFSPDLLALINYNLSIAVNPATGAQGSSRTFQARYLNTTTGDPIQGATCVLNLTRPGDYLPELPYNQAMSYNSTSGNYTLASTVYAIGIGTADIKCSVAGSNAKGGSITFMGTGSGWYDTRYLYRRNYTVTNNLGSALTYFQVNISVNTSTLISSGKMQADCDDIRFINSSGYPIDFWMVDYQCNKVNTTFWVEVPSIPASGNVNISMYYGQSDDTSASSINRTFIWGDNFENVTSLDYKSTWADWEAGNGYYFVSNGNLTMNLTTGAGAVRARLLVPQFFIPVTSIGNYIFEASVVTIPKPGILATWFSGGMAVGQYAGGGINCENRVWNGWNPNSGSYAVGDVVAAVIHNFAYASQPANNTRYTYYLYLPSSVNGNGRIGSSSATDTTDMAGSIYNLAIGGQGNANAVYIFDWIYARKYAATIPTVTASSEENGPATYSLDITDPTTGSPVSVSGGDTITVNFTFQRNGLGLTTNVSVQNITVGVQSCTLTPPSWAYRKNITVTNGMNSALTSFQVNLTVNTSDLIASGKMNPDCSDIRFYNSTGSPIDFWLVDGTCNLAVNFTDDIWVDVPNVPALGTEVISMYYGNPLATNASNITNTFLFGDDFNDGVIDPMKWNTSAPMRFIGETNGPFAHSNTGYNPIQENDGFLNFSGKRVGTDNVIEDGVGSGWLGQSLMSNVSISENNFTIETKMWHNPYNNTPCFWQYINQSNMYLIGVGQDHQNWLYTLAYSPAAANNSYLVSWRSDASYLGGPVPYVAPKAAWKRVTLEFLNGNAITRNTTFYVQPNKLANMSLGMTYTIKKVYIGTELRDDGEDHVTACSAEDQRVDWFVVRKFAQISPSSATGAEEGLPSAWYSENSWHANCTAPSGLNGLQDLFVQANSSSYSNSYANDTQTDAVNYGSATFTMISSGSVGSNTTTPAAWSGVKLYANWSTNATNLGWAVLATNETGTWQNRTSYEVIDIELATLTWSNFTWQNNSVTGGTIVGWRIYANDTTGLENVTETGTFTVGSSVLITLIRDTVDFGSIPTGDSNDTSDNSPLPFEIRNDGNVKVNITVNATDLFVQSPNPSSAYRYAANNSGEGQTYDATCSLTDWNDMPANTAPGQLFMCFLDWLDGSDQAETEILIAVPSNEDNGAKTSTVTFIGTMA